MAVKISVSAGTFFLGAAAIMLLPIEFILCGAAAALVHELCHYCVLMFFGLRVYEMKLTPLGAVMETEAVSGGQEILSALAGPLGSLMLILFAKRMPFLAVCGLVQGVFNLIPVYPFDGGRALLRLLEMCCPRWGSSVFALIEGVFLTAAAVFGIRWGMTGVALTWIGWVLLRKIPCKDAALGVQ